MRIKNIRKIKPEPARCIEVDSPRRLFSAGGDDGESIVSHNSVVQRNIIFGCIMRPESWRFLGVDLKRVELSAFRAYSNVVLGIATTLEDALIVLRFAQETMMKRYTEMEQLGVNNFLDLPEKGQALMVMVDEAGELLGGGGGGGAKALSENTVILTPYGKKLLKDLEIGEKILDNYEKECVVTNKYEPLEQSRFRLLIKKDNGGASENFIAGAEHNWVAYFEYPDGTVDGPQIVDTNFLYEFKKAQEILEPSDRVKIKFKKF